MRMNKFTTSIGLFISILSFGSSCALDADGVETDNSQGDSIDQPCFTASKDSGQNIDSLMESNFPMFTDRNFSYNEYRNTLIDGDPFSSESVFYEDREELEHARKNKPYIRAEIRCDKHSYEGSDTTIHETICDIYTGNDFTNAFANIGRSLEIIKSETDKTTIAAIGEHSFTRMPDENDENGFGYYVPNSIPNETINHLGREIEDKHILLRSYGTGESEFSVGYIKMGSQGNYDDENGCVATDLRYRVDSEGQKQWNFAQMSWNCSDEQIINHLQTVADNDAVTHDSELHCRTVEDLEFDTYYCSVNGGTSAPYLSEGGGPYVCPPVGEQFFLDHYATPYDK